MLIIFRLHRLKEIGQLTAVKPKDEDDVHLMILQLAPKRQSRTSAMTPLLRLRAPMSHF